MMMNNIHPDLERTLVLFVSVHTIDVPYLEVKLTQLEIVLE